MINWELIAMQAIGLAIIIGVTWAIVIAIRAEKRGNPPANPAGPLEDRVRVLERIATDRSADLTDEIESLRDNPKAQETV